MPSKGAARSQNKRRHFVAHTLRQVAGVKCVCLVVTDRSALRKTGCAARATATHGVEASGRKRGVVCDGSAALLRRTERSEGCRTSRIILRLIRVAPRAERACGTGEALLNRVLIEECVRTLVSTIGAAACHRLAIVAGRVALEWAPSGACTHGSLDSRTNGCRSRVSGTAGIQHGGIAFGAKVARNDRKRAHRRISTAGSECA